MHRIDQKTTQFPESSFGTGRLVVQHQQRCPVQTLTYGDATGLIVIVTGFGAGQNPGVAGYLTVSAGASLGLPDVGDLFELSGSVTVMFNTTLQDQVFDIPDAFLPLLDEGDPTTIEIFAAAPGLDGQRNPRAPPGGEVYVQASIQAELNIGGVITLIGFVQIEAAVGADGARLEVTGAVSTKIAFLGSLTGTLNFNIFIGPRTGVVGIRLAFSFWIQLLVRAERYPWLRGADGENRGASVLVSKVRELGIEEVVEDSSGNAGAAIAAYCAKAGIACRVFAIAACT